MALRNGLSYKPQQKRALAVPEMNAAKQPFAACSKLAQATS
jgi:hypothetical protein